MIHPFQYEHLWALHVHGPLAASEIAELRNRPARRIFDTTGRAVANQLRELVSRGLIEDDGGRLAIYRLTDVGRAYLAGDVRIAAVLLEAGR